MTGVYPLRRLIWLMIRTSIVHVGAAASAAALRRELSREALVAEGSFDTVFAAARLTPGTNLIALFAGLGHRVGGLGGAIAAVIVGLAPAAAISMLALWLYLAFGQLPQAASAIGAASASALAVLVWAGFRFLRDPLRTRPSATITLVAATLILQALNVPPAVVLLASAVIGSVVFRETR